MAQLGGDGRERDTEYVEEGEWMDRWTDGGRRGGRVEEAEGAGAATETARRG